MSHISRIKTQIIEKDLLLKALADLGLPVEEGEDLTLSGFGSARTPVEIKIPLRFSYPIGFRRSGESYEIVADWFGVHGVKRAEFVNQVTQRYAYHATRAKLEEQGFDLIEEVQEKGEIRLVLRRMAG
ncbi:DUF1257 domain-containing protein [bacterium]|nr:MAG: DUF1257 domain-containing protein [bacterium]